MRINRVHGESDRDVMDRRNAAYRAAIKLQVRKCLNFIMHQWPVENLDYRVSSDIRTYLPGLVNCERAIDSLFETWYKNYQFTAYIQDIQDILDTLPRPQDMPEPYSIPPQVDNYRRNRAYLKIDDLLQNTPPEPVAPQESLEHLVTIGAQPVVDSAPSKLKSLLAKLSRSADGYYQKSYVKDLQKSHSALLKLTADTPSLRSQGLGRLLQTHLEACTGNVEFLYKKILARLSISSSPAYDSAREASLIPRLSPSILLGFLARFSGVELSEHWRLVLTQYGLAIAAMQRAERLVGCGKNHADMINELINIGHANWDPLDKPEWLLLEIESNLLIRPEQAQIAREMIAPQSGKNSIMQLNMGLGKSSVIVPIVAATLADGSKLTRVVALKSLSEQMFQQTGWHNRPTRLSIAYLKIIKSNTAISDPH